MSRQWLARLAPKIRPEAVQVERHVTLPSGRDFIGYYDWMGQFDGRVAIGDNKTARRRMSQEQADKNLQPTAYAYLAGAPITFVFARAIDTGASSYSEAVVTTRSAEEIAWYGDLALEVEKAMVANVYPVNPSSNLCSKSYCTYWGVCPVGRARTVHAT
jgi:hypothetical protein